MARNYSEKLKDPRWQKKRLEILQRDNFACQRCFDNESTLHVHHRRYLVDKDPWDIPDDLLVTLCESCHEIEQIQLKDNCDDLIAFVRGKFFSDSIHELAEGFHSMEINQCDSQIIASVYSWALSEPDVQRELVERYFKHLRENNTKNGGV